MNTDTFVQMMQKGFHVTLGAASFLVDTAVTPDQQQRNDNLEKLQSGNFDRLSEEWAVTGEKKEQEAREFVESVLPKGSFPSGPINIEDGLAQTADSGPIVPGDIQDDLNSMMTELAAIRDILKTDQQD